MTDADLELERQIADVKAYVTRSLAVPLAILAPTVGVPERIIDPVVGTAECDSFIEDHDRGDEDPSERPLWTVHINLLKPIRLPGVLDMVAFTGVVSV